MRILCVYRYFWPDAAPYGKILRSMAERWSKDGHDITVLTGQPAYNDVYKKKQAKREKLGGVNIIRVFLLPEIKKLHLLRLINFIIFSLQSVFHALFSKHDLVVINSYPPILMGVTALLIKKIRNIPYIYHIQDIHPESTYIAGILKNLFIYRLLQRIDLMSCLNAKLVVTLSEDMANTLVKRGLVRSKVLVMNNFILDTNSGNREIPANLLNKSDDEFSLLFAGNIGNFQGLDTVIEAAGMLKDNLKIKFYFMGEGSAKAGLMKKSGALLNRTVFFIPFQPLETAFAVMEQSDFAIISLRPDVYRVAYPSKTMMYLAAGCPLVAIIEEESILAHEIESKGLGYAVSQNNSSKLSETISQAWNDRIVWKGRRVHIKNVATELFGRDRILGNWSKIVESIHTQSEISEKALENY